MLPAPEPTSTASIFAALGDPTRLGLVATLSDGRPRSVTELSQGAPITRQAVSKHLHVLQSAGVVGSLRSGRETRFALIPDRLTPARDYLDAVGRHWEDALARLKKLVEK